MTTIVLTGAGGSACANVVDALRLSEHAYRIVGVDASPLKLHLSRGDECAVIPRADDPAYGAALRAVIAKHGADVVHAQPDPEVLVLGALRDQLGAATFLPSQGALCLVADKAACA